MLEAGGLGAKIDKIAGAYRGNPEALQKKTKLQPDLMEALALQKVMSEKATAKQQLELSQQQDAGSVVEQMEQKLVGMNKEELTAQTAGIMGERNKKRQQQMSAAKPPQPQGQRPPTPQGAPQGLPAAPRPPMNMAQGGIIGYDAGGLVTDELLAKIGITREEYDALPQAVKDGYMADAQKEANKSKKQAEMAEKLGQPARNIGQMVGGVGDALSAVGSGITGVNKLDKEEEEEDVTATDVAAVEEPPVVAKEAPSGGLGDLKTLKDKGGINNIQGAIDGTLGSTPVMDIASNIPKEEPPVEVPSLDNAPDLSGVRETALSDKLAPELATSKGIASVDIDKERKKETDRLSEDFGRKTKFDEAKKFRDEKDALEKEQLDPKKVKKAKYNKWMEAVQGGGLRAGRGALNKFDEDREVRRRKSFDERKALFDNQSAVDIDIAGKISTEAGATVRSLMTARSEAIKIISIVKQGDIENMRAEVKQMYDANQNGIKNTLTNNATKIQSELQTLIQNQASSAQIMQLLTKFGELKRKALSDGMEPFKVEIGNLSAQLKKAAAGSTEEKNIKEKIQLYQLMALELWDLSESNDLEDKILSAAGVEQNPTNKEQDIVIGADTEDRLAELLGK